ncbi:MAG: ubiquinol-cytochrome c reductase iron-sulfur subunit [Candidatus Promineifilaceae bacterium]
MKNSIQRETSYYLLFATMGMFAVMLLVGSYWMLLPRANLPISIGTIEQYPPSDTPYKLTGVAGWLVNIDGEFSIFHNLSTYQSEKALSTQRFCPYAWNIANMRFEDPCWGSKYWLDGTVIDAPATRDLDQYRFKIRRGEIFVEAHQLVIGTCRVLPTNKNGYNPWLELHPPPACDNHLQE